MSTAANIVHVRINDSATGQPTPVRIRIADALGNYCAPLGHLAEFATGRDEDVGGNLLLGDRAYAYIDGSCEVRLPGGRLQVELHKGLEYLPRTLEIEHSAAKISLRLEIERWIDLRQQGWYSGDVRAHFLAPHAALLEAQAEDLAIVQLLALEHVVHSSDGRELPALSNILAFSGQAPALSVPGHLVAVNTCNVHPMLGSLGLLHCHRPVFPLTLGAPTSDDNWTMADWCQQCHRKRGLVVWANTRHATPAFRYGQTLAELISGNVDAFEITSGEDSSSELLSDWYTLLNCGLRVPLAAASGKESNRVALGAMRTYARLHDGEELSCSTWIEAVRAGRTFVSNGPILMLTVAARDPGAVVTLPQNGTVTVQAQAKNALPLSSLELLVNGNVAAEARASGESITTAELKLELLIDQPCWIAARCRGQDGMPSVGAEQRAFAHTSPIYIDVEGKTFVRDAHSMGRLRKELDLMAEWARNEALCDDEHRRQQLERIFLNARDALH